MKLMTAHKNIREEDIRKYFNQAAEDHISYCFRKDAIGFNYKKKLGWFVNHLSNVRGCVLDVGCNVGNLAFFIREFGLSVEQLRVIGIDIAERSIATANMRNIPGAIFQVGNALSINFPDASFDAVTLVEVIEHMPEKLSVLRELTRLLKPGGRLLLSTPNAECKPWLLDERIRFIAKSILGNAVVEKDLPLTSPELRDLLLASGLILIEGPTYYWYRPYNILKQKVWWPPFLACKGLLGAMKYCINLENNGQLTEHQKKFYCQSIVCVAGKAPQLS